MQPWKNRLSLCTTWTGELGMHLPTYGMRIKANSNRNRVGKKESRKFRGMKNMFYDRRLKAHSSARKKRLPSNC